MNSSLPHPPFALAEESRKAIPYMNWLAGSCLHALNRSLCTNSRGEGKGGLARSGCLVHTRCKEGRNQGRGMRRERRPNLQKSNQV